MKTSVSVFERDLKDLGEDIRKVEWIKGIPVSAMRIDELEEIVDACIDIMNNFAWFEESAYRLLDEIKRNDKEDKND